MTMRAGPCPLAQFDSPAFQSRGCTPCTVPAELHILLGRSMAYAAYGLPGEDAPHFVVNLDERERESIPSLQPSPGVN